MGCEGRDCISIQLTDVAQLYGSWWLRAPHFIFFKKQFHDGTYFPPPHRLSDPLLGTAGIHASVVGGQHSSGVQTPPAIRGGRLAVLKLVLWGCSMYMGLVNRTHSPAAAEGSVAPADIQIIIKRLFRRTTLLWHRSRHILYVHYDE